MDDQAYFLIGALAGACAVAAAYQGTYVTAVALGLVAAILIFLGTKAPRRGA